LAIYHALKVLKLSLLYPPQKRVFIGHRINEDIIRDKINQLKTRIQAKSRESRTTISEASPDLLTSDLAIHYPSVLSHFIQLIKGKPNSMQTAFEIPQVRRYLNYRLFLKDFYNAKKEKSQDFSYRFFARKAQISSPSHFKLVVDGKRNLTEKTLSKYIKALGFKDKNEGYFFELLVKYDQEESNSKKVEIFKSILGEKKKKGLSVLGKEQFNFLSKWHYVAIYVLVGIKGFNADPNWIASKLIKRISVANIEKAINDLIRIGLLEYDVHVGLRQTNGALDTSDEIHSLAAVPYHQNMIALASDYLENGDWRLREFNGATIPLNLKTLESLKEKMRSFRREINEMTDELDDASDVFQLNIQLFPLTEPKI